MLTGSGLSLVPRSGTAHVRRSARWRCPRGPDSGVRMIEPSFRPSAGGIIAATDQPACRRALVVPPVRGRHHCGSVVPDRSWILSAVVPPVRGRHHCGDVSHRRVGSRGHVVPPVRGRHHCGRCSGRTGHRPACRSARPRAASLRRRVPRCRPQHRRSFRPSAGGIIAATSHRAECAPATGSFRPSAGGIIAATVALSAPACRWRVVPPVRGRHHCGTLPAFVRMTVGSSFRPSAGGIIAAATSTDITLDPSVVPPVRGRHHCGR